MEAGITTNFPAFKKALDLYVRVSRKAVFDSVRNAMADVAFEAAANTYNTTKEQIDKQFQSLPIKGEEKGRRYGDTRFVGQYKIINWERKNKGMMPLGGSKFRTKAVKIKSVSYFDPYDSRIKTRIDIKKTKTKNVPRNTGPSLGINRFMDGKYKAFLQARKRSVKWLRIGWAAAAEMMGKPFRRGDFGPATIQRVIGLKYGGGEVRPITENITEFMIFNNTGRFDTRYSPVRSRSSSDIARADAIMTKGLEAGIQKVLYDPKKGLVPYISARLKRLWDSPTNIVS
jgi:hypothetical protein